MFISQNNSPKNNRKENANLNEDQKTIERLRFLLKNAIQLNDELERKNNLLKYRLEEFENSSQLMNQQLDSRQQLEKLQQQIAEVKQENQQLSLNLEKAKLSQKSIKVQNNGFELNLQACQISIIEQQFYDYFDKQDKVAQEQIILEFQKRLEEVQTKFQIVEINKINDPSFFKQSQLIAEQQSQIEELQNKVQKLEKEINEQKIDSVEEHPSIQDYGHDFFGSNQFEIFSSRINNSQKIEEAISTDKKWIDLDNNDEKQLEKKVKELEKLIQTQKQEIQQQQCKISTLSKKKNMLKVQNTELSTVMYQQAETCQRIIQSLQAKVEKQKAQISYFQSLQFMKYHQKNNNLNSQVNNLTVQPLDMRNKFTYHSPNSNNSPVSITKATHHSRYLKKQDSSSDQTNWNIKTIDASLLKKTNDKKDSQSESTSDQIVKSTKLSMHLQEVKKSLDQMSNVMSSQKQINGYYFAKNKPILTLEDF